MTVLLLVKSVAILAVAFVVTRYVARSSAERHAGWVMSCAALIGLFLSTYAPLSMTPISGAFTIQVDSSALQSGSTAARDWLPLVWGIGSMLCLVRLLVDVLRTMLIIRTARVSERAAGYEIRTTPRLTSPVAWGLGTKLVLLPENAETWNEDRRRIVLDHELSHLRRNDAWALLIAEIACALFWLNPLVWIAASRLRREQEHAADDAVIGSGADPITYADHLVALARVERTAALTAGVVSQSNLTARVEAILDSRRLRRMPTRRNLFASAFTIAALLFPLLTLQAERKIYKVSEGGITPPKTVHKVEPQYTQEAKDAKIQGQVVLSGVVDIDGTFKDLKVARGLDAGLDANALAAVQQWLASPALKDGEPVPVSVEIQVNFTLL